MKRLAPEDAAALKRLLYWVSWLRVQRIRPLRIKVNGSEYVRLYEIAGGHPCESVEASGVPVTVRT